MKEKIGFIIPPIGGDIPQIVRTSKIADEMGFHSIWAAEAWGKDAFTLLTTVACNTKKIQIGTAIVNIFSRTAGVLAMTAATIDELSGGRFILGLGTSGNKVIEGFHGIPFDKPLTRMKEYVDIIRILLRGGRVSEHQGTLLKLEKFRLQFKPARADMPVYIASLTPKSVEQTGEIADGWMPTYYPLSRFHNPLELLQKGMDKAGKKKGDVKVCPMLTMLVGDDVESERSKVRYPLAFYITSMGKFYYEMLSREGYQKECDAVREIWAKGDQGGAMNAIPVEMLDDITVYGTPEMCKEKLKKWVDAGIDFCLAPMPVGDEKEVRKILERLA